MNKKTHGEIKEVIIGSDHAGFELKEKIIEWMINSTNLVIRDVGTYHQESTDYPDFSHKVAGILYPYRIGILICGSGNGVCMTANKWNHVRAALCWNSDLSMLARKHNDSNLLCLPARFISTFEALKTVEIFLESEFEGGRHQERIQKIPIQNV